MNTTENQNAPETVTAAGVVSTALLGSSIIRCGECLAPATWHADHCDAGRVYYCGKCVAIPNRDGELSQLRRMPPGRDNIPATHPRRIAKLAESCTARDLAMESPAVRKLVTEHRAAQALKLSGGLYSTDENGNETPISVFHSA